MWVGSWSSSGGGDGGDGGEGGNKNAHFSEPAFVAMNITLRIKLQAEAL